MNQQIFDNLFKAVVHESEDYITISDSSGAIVYANPAVGKDGTEYSPSALIGGKVWDFLIPGEPVEPLKEVFKNVLKGESWVGALPFMNSTGETLWTTSRFFPVNDGDNSQTFIVGVHRNITEWKQKELDTEFRLSIEKFISDLSRRLIPPADLDGAIDCSLAELGELFRVDRVYIFEVFRESGAMSNIYEWTADGITPEIESLQNLPIDVFPWWMQQFADGKTISMATLEDLPSAAAPERDMLEAQAIKSLLVVPYANGKYFTGYMGLDVVKLPRKWRPEDENILVTALEIIARAIENDRSEQERIRLEEQLVEANKMEAIGLLAAGVAHDFNNLLAVVRGGVSLLRTHPKSRKVTDNCLNDIEDAAKRAGELTRSLLTYSRRDSMQIQPCDFTELLNEAISLTRRSMPDEIDLLYKQKDNLPHVDCDSGRILQVLINLIYNARDAIKGPGKIIISVTSKRVTSRRITPHFNIEPGRYVVISVSDTGCGMTKEVSDKVFDPFFSTKGAEGTGLGMSNAYGIIKDHKGAVVIETEPGDGSTFFLYLPAEL